MKQSSNQLRFLMGSDSDLDVMMETAKILDGFKVSYDIEITSAHRSPDRTRAYVRSAERMAHDSSSSGRVRLRISPG